MSIFPRADLETLGFAVVIDERHMLRGLDVLTRLQHLHRAGYWGTLSESNVEQSFVERVFADVFGYRTLLSAGAADVSHEVLPKLYVPLQGRRAFPDFALGYFRADQQQAVVTAELKSPGANLDAAQGGNYGGRSPVQQALTAAAAAGAEWCVVSNTDEVRLYRVSHPHSYEQVFLAQVVSPMQFRRAYALFSRSSLLGRSESERSPLSRLFAHTQSGESMLVPQREDRVRLVMRVKPEIALEEFPFTQLSGALRDALVAVPAVNVLGGAFLRPQLQDDQLVFDRRSNNGQGDAWQRIATVKSGVLVGSYSIPLDVDASQPGQPILVDPANTLHLMADFTAFAWKFYEQLTTSALTFEFSLEDLGGRVRANDRHRWTQPTQHVSLSCQATVTRTSFPEFRWQGSVARATVSTRLGDVLRELFFPFEGLDNQGTLCRLEPTAAQTDTELQGATSLSVFP